MSKSFKKKQVPSEENTRGQEDENVKENEMAAADVSVEATGDVAEVVPEGQHQEDIDIALDGNVEGDQSAPTLGESAYLSVKIEYFYNLHHP